MYNSNGYRTICPNCDNVVIDHWEQPRRCPECGYIFILNDKDDIESVRKMLSCADLITQKEIVSDYLQDSKTVKEQLIDDFLILFVKCIYEESEVTEHHLQFIKDVLGVKLSESEYIKFEESCSEYIKNEYVPCSIKIFAKYDNDILSEKNIICTKSFQLLTTIRNVCSNFVRCCYDMNRSKLDPVYEICETITTYQQQTLDFYKDKDIKDYGLDREADTDIIGIMSYDYDKLMTICELALNKKKEVLDYCRRYRNIPEFSITRTGNSVKGYTYHYNHYFHTEMQNMEEELNRYGHSLAAGFAKIFGVEDEADDLKFDLSLGMFIAPKELIQESLNILNKIERNMDIDLQRQMANVKGLPFGIITNSFLSVTWYAILNESKKIGAMQDAEIRNFDEKHQKWYQAETYYRRIWQEIYDKSAEIKIVEQIDSVLKECFEKYVCKRAEELNVFNEDQLYSVFYDVVLKEFNSDEQKEKRKERERKRKIELEKLERERQQRELEKQRIEAEKKRIETEKQMKRKEIQDMIDKKQREQKALGVALWGKKKEDKLRLQEDIEKLQKELYTI